MPKKGFVHLASLFFIAVLLISGFTLLSIQRENQKKQAVGKVLSESSGGDNHQEGDSGGSSGAVGQSSSTSNSSGASSDLKAESKSGGFETKIEKARGKSNIEIQNNLGKFHTETQAGKTETKIETEGLKIEFTNEGNKVVTKIKNKGNKEVEVDEEVEKELKKETENELEDNDIEIATGSAGLGFVQKGNKVRTNFPLSINLATGELLVTTPAGVRAVTILPDAAIQNMIRAGVLTRVETSAPSPSPSGGGGTPSASVLGAGIELTQQNNQAVYVINGVKSQKLLGLVPIDVKLKTIVSVSDGKLLDIQEGLFDRLVDLVSF